MLSLSDQNDLLLRLVLDSSLVTSRLMLHFDDTLSVVNDAQLNSALNTYKEIIHLMKRASEQRKRIAGEKLTVGQEKEKDDWGCLHLAIGTTTTIVVLSTKATRCGHDESRNGFNAERWSSERCLRSVRYSRNLVTLQHQTIRSSYHRRLRISQYVG